MQLVAGRAIGRLENHRQRLASLLAPQVVRRPQEERLVVQARARGLSNGAAKIFRQRLASLEPRGHVIEHGLEALRWVIAIEARHHGALLVEEKESRRELHLEQTRELLFGHDAAVDPGDFAVAP